MQTTVRLCLLAFTLLACTPPTRGEQALQGHVTDRAQLLSAGELEQLRKLLSDHEAATGQQFALLIVPNLRGKTIEEFSMEVAEQTGLGRAEYDDGLLMLLSVQDHKVRIEVGYGLERAIPDEYAAAVIREVMVPAFRANRYGAGLRDAVQALIARTAHAKLVRRPSRRRNSSSPWPWLAVPSSLAIAAGAWWLRRRRAR